MLIIGYVLAILVCTSFYYPDYTMHDIIVMTVNSIWKFLGFHAAGLRSMGNEFFNLNGPMWFISGIIIAGYFMYWAICKSEDGFSGFFAPFVAIFLTGWWCFSGTRASQTAWSTFGAQTTSTNGMGGDATDTTAVIGFNNGVVFVVLGMLIGVLLFYLIRRLSAHEFTAGQKAALTVLNVVCSVLLVWYILYQPTWFELERWTVAFLCLVVIGLSLLNKDGLTALLNNRYTSGLLAYLLGGLLADRTPALADAWLCCGEASAAGALGALLTALITALSASSGVGLHIGAALCCAFLALMGGGILCFLRRYVTVRFTCGCSQCC